MWLGDVMEALMDQKHMGTQGREWHDDPFEAQTKMTHEGQG